jgi:hypothetical protein
MRATSRYRSHVDYDGVESDWQGRISVAMKHAEDLAPMMQTPPRCEPGSALAGDDARFSLMPTSNLAWTGLLSAIEHFSAGALLWRATDHGTLPTAFSTLLRPALVGACQAHWLLAPTRRDDRVHRTLLLAHEETKRAKDVVDDVLKVQVAPDAADSPLRVRARAMQKTYADRLAAIDDKIDGRLLPKWFTQTEVIRAVAADLYSTEPSNERAILYLWRITSGDAHSLLWPKLGRFVGADTQRVDEKTALLRDVKTFEALGTLVLTVSSILDRALELHSVRRTKHY